MIDGCIPLCVTAVFYSKAGAKSLKGCELRVARRVFSNCLNKIQIFTWYY